MSTVIIKKEIEVPVGALIEVADLLLEHEISNEIIATDEENDTITLEVCYEREQKEVMHDINDIIEEYDADDDDDENKDDE